MVNTPGGFGRICGKELEEEDTRATVLVSFSFNVKVCYDII